MKCQHCGKEFALPFKCPFCSQYYCSEHRLPENHSCPEYWKVLSSRRQARAPVITKREAGTAPPEHVVPYPPPSSLRRFRFSSVEIRHLAVSAVLVMGVGLSIVLQIELNHSITPEILVSLAVVFTSAFLVHELAHKLSAHRFGLWAEFRLTLFGAIITLLSIFLPFFKIISPGAVIISGFLERETAGKIATAGPLTNTLLSALFFIFALFPPIPIVQKVLMLSSAWNAWIALINLIPLGMLDGLKVFKWNKPVWVAVFIASSALAFSTFTYLS